MALFSRRKNDSNPAPADVPETPEVDTADVNLPEEIVPEVGISFSTFGKAATVPSMTRPEAQKPATPVAPAIAGMPDNALVRHALQALPEKPETSHIMNVMRQALQGHLYLRVQGDAREAIAEGKPLANAVMMIGDERYMIAYSGGNALQDSVKADGDTKTSAVGQPVSVIFANALEGPYAGIVLDPATPGARLAIPKALIEKSVEEADPEFTLKGLLAHERSETTLVDVAAALTTVKLWVAGGQSVEGGPMGLAESRSVDGERRLEIFSHPLEVIALGRGDRPLPLAPANLAAALKANPGLAGVVIDPAGPWMQVDRVHLGAVLALAE